MAELAPPRESVRRTSSADLAVAQKALQEAAVGPPLELRAVTQAEYSAGKQILKEAAAASNSAAALAAARQQFEKELTGAQEQTADVTAELDKVKEENKKLKSEFEELHKKFINTDIACTKSLSQLAKTKRDCEDVKTERDSLCAEVEHLLDEIDILNENLKIQENNVETLRQLAEKLQEDIVRYKKKQEEMAEKHRLAVLRMETEMAKDVDELNKEYEAKEAELRTKLRESEAARLHADQDWMAREGRLERSVKEELKAKNDELQKLRTRIEQLLRDQLDTMRHRVDPRAQPDGDARLHQKHLISKAARAPVDVNVQTAKVLSAVSAGKKILALELLAKSDAFRSPVYWKGESPVHVGDPTSLDVGVKLSVDSSVLKSIPIAARPSLSTTLYPGQDQSWCFGTLHGAEVVVSLRLIPPGSKMRQ